MDKQLEEVEIGLRAKSVTLEDVKEVCKKYLYLPNDNIVDYILAIYLSDVTKSERLWSWIIGPPSVGKTELLRALSSDSSVSVDSLTAKTLFSGLRIGNRDPSLFKRLNNKVLIIKDFTKILSDRPETLSEILGQLRSAKDGYYDACTGVEDKHYHYETNFTLLAGVTPAIDDHYSVRQALGERFLSWRITGIDRKKLSAKIKETEGETIKMRRSLRLNFAAFIKRYNATKEIPKVENGIAIKIGELADIATWARTPVSRFGYTREVRRMPEKEGSPRLYKELLSLGKALALVRSKLSVTEVEYSLLYKVAFDSMLPERIEAINLLVAMTKELRDENFLEDEVYIPTPQISDRLNLPTQTSRIILDDLFLLQILKRKGENPLLWSMDSEFMQQWIDAKPECVG